MNIRSLWHFITAIFVPSVPKWGQKCRDQICCREKKFRDYKEHSIPTLEGMAVTQSAKFLP
jgi:hypothetical protein